MNLIRLANFTYAGLLFVFPLFGQEHREALRLIHADQLKREVIGRKVRQRLEGRVEFRQGKTTIRCDVAMQVLGEEPTALIGRVQIYDESRTLHADTVYFYEKESKQIAVGHVLSITESDTTVAHRITYYQEANRVVSEKNVRIVNRYDRTILTGQFAEYLRNEEHGKILGHPELVKLDSLGSEYMRVVGDTMELFNGGDTTVVRGAVRMTQRGTMATCGQAEYFKSEEKTILTDNPTVVQSNRQITGDTLLLYLEDSRLSRAFVRGHAMATSDADTLNKGRWVNKLTGQTMEFYFQDKKLRKVVINDQATSLYHVIENNQYKGANEVSGDRIVVYMPDGVPQRVAVTSSPEFSSGKFSPPRM